MTGSDRSHAFPALSHVWQHIKLSDISLGAGPRYSIVVAEDVKKPYKQTKKNKQRTSLVSPFKAGYPPVHGVQNEGMGLGYRF